MFYPRSIPVLSHYNPMFSPFYPCPPHGFPNFPTPGVPNSYTKDQFPKRPPSPKPGKIFETISPGVTIFWAARYFICYITY